MAVCAVVAIAAAAIAVVVVGTPGDGTGVGTSESRPTFPTIDTAGLSAQRARVVAVAGKEYTSNPGPDKYTGASNEPWCADFVSWVLNESGVPLVNPNSGSWRIPGTFTLREFYQSTGRFRSAESGYRPRPGDVAIYDNPGFFGEHTNIVVSGDMQSLRTVGGNEPGGIRLYTDTQVTSSGLVGFGVPTAG